MYEYTKTEITFTLLFGTLMFIATVSFAATYPASCPAEAKAIVEAVGGCSVVNKSQYPSVYDKCCILPVSAPATTKSLSPIPSKAPSQLTPPAPSASPLSPKSTKSPEFTEPFRDFPSLAPSTQTPEPKPTPPPPQPKNPIKIIKEEFQRVFSRIFQFLRFR